MLIIFDLHCIVLVTSTWIEVPTHTHLRRGYVDREFPLGIVKLKSWVSTQVPPEKGWFCMLIIFTLLCIVLVTFEGKG